MRAHTTVDLQKGRAVLCIVAPNRLLHKKPRYYFSISFVDCGTVFGEWTQIEMHVSSDIQFAIIRFSPLHVSVCRLTQQRVSNVVTYNSACLSLNNVSDCFIVW